MQILNGSSSRKDLFVIKDIVNGEEIEYKHSYEELDITDLIQNFIK